MEHRWVKLTGWGQVGNPVWVNLDTATRMLIAHEGKTQITLSGGQAANVEVRESPEEILRQLDQERPAPDVAERPAQRRISKPRKLGWD
jgi:hypothetical protein